VCAIFVFIVMIMLVSSVNDEKISTNNNKTQLHNIIQVDRFTNTNIEQFHYRFKYSIDIVVECPNRVEYFVQYKVGNICNIIV